MEIHEKNIGFEVKRKISYISLGLSLNNLGESEIFVFKDVYKIKNSIIKEIQGITLMKYISYAENDGPIETLKLNLYHKSVLKLHIYNRYDNNYYERMKQKLKSCPFTFINSLNSRNKDWNDNYILLQHDYSSDDLLDINAKPFPKGLSIDYSSIVPISNENFHLKKLLEYLKLFPNRFQLKSDNIKDIPSYNRDEDRHSYIPFIYFPTEEEYQKIYEMRNKYDSFNPLFKKCMFEQMGIEKFLKDK